MSCNDCRDPSNNGTAAIYIIYTGGPPQAPFAAMRIAIPDDKVSRRYRPTIHPDGRIEYRPDTLPPSVPEGYQTEPSRPWILRPMWLSCIYRTYRVQTLDNGTLQISAQCLTSTSGKRPHEKLTDAFCRQCPARRPITDTTGESPAPPDPPAKSTA